MRNLATSRARACLTSFNPHSTPIHHPFKCACLPRPRPAPGTFPFNPHSPPIQVRLSASPEARSRERCAKGEANRGAIRVARCMCAALLAFRAIELNWRAACVLLSSQASRTASSSWRRAWRKAARGRLCSTRCRTSSTRVAWTKSRDTLRARRTSAASAIRPVSLRGLPR